jgi:hypothetical protein
LRTPFVVLTRPTVNSTGSFVNSDGTVRRNDDAVRCFGRSVREIFRVADGSLGRIHAFDVQADRIERRDHSDEFAGRKKSERAAVDAES